MPLVVVTIRLNVDFVQYQSCLINNQIPKKLTAGTIYTLSWKAFLYAYLAPHQLGHIHLLLHYS